MQTVQTTHILTIRARITTKTSRVGATLDRKIFFVQNNIAEDICNRNLSGRNQIEVIYLAVVHLTLFVRELSRSVTGILIHNQRWLNLKVSTFTCFFEEKCLKRTLQASHRSNIYRKSCTADLNTQVKVYQIEFLA